MFDQYGTVVDMQSGLTEAAAPYLEAKGWPGNPHSLVTWWRRTHYENSLIDALLLKTHTPYREIGQRSLSYVLERAGIVHSNGDPDMLEAARQHHGIPFDRLISVAEANAFKPHVATYTRAAELIGARLDEVLFVANHVFDCIGAKAAGMRAAFIDKRGRPFGITPYQPDVRVPTMTHLADLMA
jgi:2-haloacid dehalogenase